MMGIALALHVGAARADEPKRCERAADCEDGFDCVEKHCRESEFVDIDRVAPNPKVTFAPYKMPAVQQPSTRSETLPDRVTPKKPPFVLKGTHAFGGLVMMIGGDVPGRSPGNAGYANDWGSGGGVFLFALRGGVLVDHHEMAIEISPGTYATSDPYSSKTPACAAPGSSYYYNTCSSGPVFQLVGTYRHLFTLHGGVNTDIFWPLGGGIGVVKELGSELAFFQARVDAVGVTIRSDRLLIDLHFPSFRYAVTRTMMTVDDPSWTAPHCWAGGRATACTPATMQMLTWFFGGAVSYVF